MVSTDTTSVVPTANEYR